LAKWPHPVAQDARKRAGVPPTGFIALYGPPARPETSRCWNQQKLDLSF
jgi:hypothetical protein